MKKVSNPLSYERFIKLQHIYKDIGLVKFKIVKEDIYNITYDNRRPKFVVIDNTSGEEDVYMVDNIYNMQKCELCMISNVDSVGEFAELMYEPDIDKCVVSGFMCKKCFGKMIEGLEEEFRFDE